MSDFQNASDALRYYAGHIMGEGAEVGSRVGRTMEITHSHFALKKPWQREILVAGRKPNIAAQIAETMWVLSGRGDIEWLGYYLPRAADFSDDGQVWRAAYGPRLRAWGYQGQPVEDDVDQLAECYRLLKADSATRRAVMSLWDPAADYTESKDIPCNNWLSWSSRLGYLDLSVAIRSNDLIWGWSGVNQFEWSALLEIMAGMLGLRVGKLVFTQTSFHIYDHHWDTAKRIGDIGHYTAHLPQVSATDSPRFDATLGGSGFRLDDIGLDNLVEQWFALEYDIRTGSPLAFGYVNVFPEPMMRSWLHVLQWWWSKGDRSYLEPLKGTRLEAATLDTFSVQPKRDAPPLVLGGPDEMAVQREPVTKEESTFISSVIALHNEKDRAYGTSWKKRGELFSIIPNIARKVDRLGGSETADETSADTAIDLLVYLAKYRVWMDEQFGGPIFNNWGGSDSPGAANEVLLDQDRNYQRGQVDDHELATAGLKDLFENLVNGVEATGSGSETVKMLDAMLPLAYGLARFLWVVEQIRTSKMSVNEARTMNVLPAFENDDDRYDPLS